MELPHRSPTAIFATRVAFCAVLAGASLRSLGSLRTRGERCRKGAGRGGTGLLEWRARYLSGDYRQRFIVVCCPKRAYDFPENVHEN